ncbi:hypothetical protein GCM10009103_41880 [Pseudomonas koreensis]|nr:hypothetical protein GCM10009103_41880 [Pseudomonas koreensis]
MHGDPALLDHRRDYGFDLMTTTVIAYDDFEMAITLTDGAAQCAFEEARIEGGNDQADEREWIHGGLTGGTSPLGKASP